MYVCHLLGLHLWLVGAHLVLMDLCSFFACASPALAAILPPPGASCNLWRCRPPRRNQRHSLRVIVVLALLWKCCYGWLKKSWFQKTHLWSQSGISNEVSYKNHFAPTPAPLLLKDCVDPEAADALRWKCRCEERWKMIPERRQKNPPNILHLYKYSTVNVSILISILSNLSLKSIATSPAFSTTIPHQTPAPPWYGRKQPLWTSSRPRDGHLRDLEVAE